MSHSEAPFNEWLLAIVRCPISGQRLAPASRQLLERVNQLARAGKLRARSGETIQGDILAGLVNPARTIFYREHEGTFWLLALDAIELDADSDTAQGLVL